MKNRLEAELISIAHRILKLKNKSEIIQLQQETLRLYEKLSVLRFVEENYDDSAVSIPEDIEKKIEEPIQQKEEATKEVETKDEKIIVEEKTIEIKEEIIEVPIKDENTTITEEKTTEEESPKETFSFDSRFEKFEAQLANAKPNKTPPTIFDEITSVEEPVFIPVAQQIEVKKTETTTIETTKSISINDAVRKNFNIGLNDKIAFEFHLFAGKSEDFNRVLSQLNTFNTFTEAKDFIETLVKPDYNNWIAKDEYANRFMEIIESKF